jgi:hypothetical protein
VRGDISLCLRDDTYENYGRWRLTVHFLIIAGIVNRNLALLGQIIKSDVKQPCEEKWFYPKTAE